jgi:hypothetical protein
MLHAARPAARAARRGVAPLQVRAFKTDDPSAAQHGAAAKEQAPERAVAPRAAAAAPALHGPARLHNLFDEMEAEMGQLTRAFFGDDAWMWPFSSRPARRAAPQLDGLASSVSAAAKPLLFDLHETDAAFTIKADVPGM